MDVNTTPMTDAVNLRDELEAVGIEEILSQVDRAGRRWGIQIHLPNLNALHACSGRAPALRTVGCVGFRRVSNIAAGHFVPLQPEAGFVLRPVDDEGQPHRFPAVAGIERRHPDVAVAVHLAALIEDRKSTRLNSSHT